MPIYAFKELYQLFGGDCFLLTDSYRFTFMSKRMPVTIAARTDPTNNDFSNIEF